MVSYEPIYLRLRVLEAQVSNQEETKKDVYEFYSSQKTGRSNLKCIDEVLVKAEKEIPNRSSFDYILGDGVTEQLLNLIESSVKEKIKQKILKTTPLFKDRGFGKD